MKSIKEKAGEYADEQDLRMAYNGSCDNCRQGFIAGANYVLVVIEEILPKEDKNLNDYGKALVWRIKDIIEQLKSNQ
jgi:hypothetical protein